MKLSIYIWLPLYIIGVFLGIKIGYDKGKNYFDNAIGVSCYYSRLKAYEEDNELNKDDVFLETKFDKVGSAIMWDFTEPIVLYRLQVNSFEISRDELNSQSEEEKKDIQNYLSILLNQ